ncbi:hypothetical protein KC660_00400 [Candidatus Dojkabacteria bacterium]|uniref:Uncharacterized protein n=1 Tax=Candidatus Dojkabacteria bacterium TaxID=2099670 RepID=A0A955RHJ1_9BACT|nr:hypothetical protein [Candidatus Dojkabacteria bacterium]
MNRFFAKFKKGIKDPKGSILLSVFIINIIALIIGMLLSSLAVEQLRNSYRNIRSSSALGVSQAGLEDALARISELERWYQANCITMTSAQCTAVLAELDSLKANGGTCTTGLLSDGRTCAWYWEQDSVIGTIKKDHAVTYDISDINYTTANPFYMVWQCPPNASGADTGSGMVVTFIADNGGTLVIPDDGKIAIKCTNAPDNITNFTPPSAAADPGAPIGDGGTPINVNRTSITVPPGVKYLRIRAVANDVRYLRLITDLGDYESYIQNNADENYAFRDVITSEGIDGISRYTSLARSKDLQVPALFDFVLYTEGAISK